MEWTEERILDFINDVCQRSCLWDPGSADRKNKRKVRDMWKELSVIYSSAPVDDLKDKWRNLCQSYRNYRRKVQSKKRSGSGTSELYTPKWFAYHAMDVFMNDTYHPINTTDAVNTTGKAYFFHINKLTCNA